VPGTGETLGKVHVASPSPRSRKLTDGDESAMNIRGELLRKDGSNSSPLLLS
jgi:hypothetical protein